MTPQIVSRSYIGFGKFQGLKKDDSSKDGTRKAAGQAVYQPPALLQTGRNVRRRGCACQLWPADTHVKYDANVNTTVNKLASFSVFTGSASFRGHDSRKGTV